jgi:hypothetical protein
LRGTPCDDLADGNSTQPCNNLLDQPAARNGFHDHCSYYSSIGVRKSIRIIADLDNIRDVPILPKPGCSFYDKISSINRKNVINGGFLK